MDSTIIPTNEQIRAMDGEQLTWLAYDLGLAPCDVRAPKLRETGMPCYHSEDGIKWQPHIDVQQAREVFFDRLGALGFGLSYSGYKEYIVLQVFPPGYEDNPFLLNKVGLEGISQARISIALLRCACLAVAAQHRGEEGET